MLVLTRKQNEQIQIGDNILLTVLRIKGNTVRLGIEAPTDVRVVRGELPRRPQFKDVTLMSTDPSTGEISETWSRRSDQPAKRGASHRGGRPMDSPERQDVREEVNRLHEIVGQVTSSSWTLNSPVTPS